MLAWLFEAIPVSRRFQSACLIVLFLVAGASAEANDRVDTGTLVGKMIMGYQGWFACPDDGGGLGWGHWTRGTDPAVDMLPDLSDMPEAAQCLTMMKTSDGHTVKLFSNLNLETEEEHFAWMQQYGIDGVALQRFATVLLKPSLLADLDRVLGNVRRAAEEHTRVFFIMYDLSGVPSVDLPAVAKDWERLEHEGLTRSTAYLHHRGHPLLGVWGLGFAGGSVSPHNAEKLLDAFAVASAPYGGVTVLGGVPSYWRSREHDASPDPKWEQIWRRLDVISPWSVGRFADDAGADTYRRTVLEPDLKATRALGVDYMPVIFPGFSFANASRALHQLDKAIPNKIPRRCGLFYWRQVYNALTAGASMLYGAMFDEVNEGTAMFKMLPSPAKAPISGTPPGYSFVTLDADGCRLPSDWYLRLGGAARSALYNGTRPSPTLPFSLPAK
jgi:hypothetical protein